MKIQVLGSGCPSCKQMFETTKKVSQDLSLDAEIEYITDTKKIIEMGLMATPVLAVDGKAVLSGKGKSENDIKEVLQDSAQDSDRTCSGCSCGSSFC